MNANRMLALIVIAGAVLPAYADTPVPPVAPLPALVALQAAEAALDACVAQGLTVTVTITDRDGVARVILMSDNTGPTSIVTSRRKAYSAASLGISTAELLKISTDLHIVPSSVDADLLPLAGGLPIRAHNVVIGGIGVGGADRGNADEECAQAGLDAIKDQLR